MIMRIIESGKTFDEMYKFLQSNKIDIYFDPSKLFGIKKLVDEAIEKIQKYTEIQKAIFMNQISTTSEDINQLKYDLIMHLISISFSTINMVSIDVSNIQKEQNE